MAAGGLYAIERSAHLTPTMLSQGISYRSYRLCLQQVKAMGSVSPPEAQPLQSYILIVKRSFSCSDEIVGFQNLAVEMVAIRGRAATSGSGLPLELAEGFFSADAVCLPSAAVR